MWSKGETKDLCQQFKGGNKTKEGMRCTMLKEQQIEENSLCTLFRVGLILVCFTGRGTKLVVTRVEWLLIAVGSM